MLCQFNNNGAHVPAIDLCNGKKYNNQLIVMGEL